MKKSTWLIASGVVIIFLGILTFAIKDTIRETIVVPLFYLIGLSRVIYESLPQRMVWGLLVVGGIYLAARSIGTPYQRKKVEEEPKLNYRGRVEIWAKWIELASQGNLSKLKLGRELEDLTLNALAYQYQQSEEVIRQRIQQGEIVLSKEHEALIRKGTGIKPTSPFQRFVNRFQPDGDKASLDAQIDGIVKFLEDELEVHGDEYRR